MSKQEQLKKETAEKAVEQVKSGMILGLGTGSTTSYAVKKIGELWQAGQLTDIIGIPTSERTAKLAGQYGIPLASLNDHPNIDLTIDGADEVDPQLNLVKGLGGALLREKIIATASRKFIAIVDESKLVDRLGTLAPLPVEVTQFAVQAHRYWLEQLPCRPVLRSTNDVPYVTDNGNYIIDCHFLNGIEDATKLSMRLHHHPGILDHGLFLNIASEVVVAGQSGIRSLMR
ncbi:ribose-5-phosphate isomerase RpiA [Anaerolineales bacterium HSG6]|nr:ribose-5-phosphate isomerase RpiA [Anaerolineales bacterium HSG6]MDM8529955.1 ribose-5-phosphate isomerase RpiA [Anaerolineales bacterium HSG25]